MSPTKFDPYKVDRLFLLIGENPLPNYVAARLLLRESGIPYLVYTKGTKGQAQRLQEILDNEPTGSKSTKLVSLEEYESDAYQIQRRIQDTLEKIGTEQVGLNYTGGTKAMAVHTYRAVFEATQKKGQKAVFSYLDPRRLEMCVDREEGDRIRLKVEPEDLEVKIAKVFQIHGWELLSDSDPPHYVPNCPDAALAFANFHASPECGKLWRQWCNKVLRKATCDKSGKWLPESKLRSVSPVSLMLPSEQETSTSPSSLKEVPEIIKALKILGYSDSADTISLQEIEKKGFKKLIEVCKWLDGEWLEDYVLQQVQEVPKNLKIYESAASFWIKDPASKERRTKFQFDVAFTRGYQLFAISCTTIVEKPECKQKLFEAYVRARQLGGDEARVALVCCANKENTNALRTEITNVFKSSSDSDTQDDSRLIVFGHDDLLNLSNRIADWIRDNDAELDR